MQSADSNTNLLADKALIIRRKAISNLDQLLVEFETAFLKGRGKLHWAINDDEAFQIVLRILQSSDLGDYFIEKNDPIIKELVLADRLNSKANLNSIATINKKSAFISGCAFACAEQPTAYFSKKGVSKVLLNNDVLPILIISIDQLIASLVDLHALAPLICQSSNDSFELISLLHTSKLNVILVDNGRAELLAKSPQNQLLELGHPKYFLKENSDSKQIEQLYYGHLGKNDPLTLVDAYCIDGYTKNTLLLDISIADIVIAGREQKAQIVKSESDIIWRTWKSAMLNRKVLNRSSFGPISLMKSFYKRGFGNLRSFPKVEKGSFSEQWLKDRPNVVESRKLTDIPKGQLLVRKPATDGLSD